MKRITYWALSTVTALVLLFGYHTSTSGPSLSADTSIESGSPGSGSGSETDSGSSPDAPSGTGGSGTDAAPSTGDVTATGDAADTRWGPVQVAITVSDGRITDVSVPMSPNGNPKDVQINDYALPILVDETLAAQSADIDMVSGATVTSLGYLQSLQSALDQAGL